MNEISELLVGKEKEQNTREIILHLVRHGAAEYKKHRDPDGFLNKEGEGQAATVGEKLFDEIQDGEAVKFYSSPLLRARQTAKIIRETLVNKISQTEKKIKILEGDLRSKRGLTSIDQVTSIYWELREQGVRDPVRYWLENPQEKPEEAIRVFKEMINHFRELATRISPEEPRLHLVCVTHGGSPEIFLSEVTGQSDFSNLGNCETVKFIFSQNRTEEPKVIFRENEYQIKR